MNAAESLDIITESPSGDPYNRVGKTAIFDWRNPDYAPIWRKRVQRLAKLRNGDPEKGITAAEYQQACRIHYKHNIADFISDWGVTVDPRNAGTERPIILPFILFPRQREFIDFIVRKWTERKDGVMVKSRDCGASWLAMAASVTLCLFWENVSIGFGSAKEDKVDRSGDPDSLFYKGRMFARYLPRDFKGDWDERKNSAHMRLIFPASESSITGEAGDNIGRGGRKTIYFVDEFAFVERPKLVDASLSANTKCRIEMSTVQGLANTFAEHARAGKHERFDFDYHDDPRYCDQETKQPYPDFAEFLANLDPVVKAAEYDRDFLASAEGVLIEQAWVQAAINAAAKLGIATTGVKRISYDPADEGKDKNAAIVRWGVEIVHAEQWSGATQSKMLDSCRRVSDLADTWGCEEVTYDGDGLGAGVKALAIVVNEERVKSGRKPLAWNMFRGSGKVLDPTLKTPGTDRKNEDYLENQKAQSWHSLMRQFLETFKAINGEKYHPDNIISISPKIKLLTALTGELSQPTKTWSKTGKMVVEKTPDGVASPNLADGAMMGYAYTRPPISIHPNVKRLYMAQAQQDSRNEPV